MRERGGGRGANTESGGQATGPSGARRAAASILPSAQAWTHASMAVPPRGRPRRDAYREILSRADIWGATRASLLLTAHVDGHQRQAHTPSSPTSDKAAVLTAASKTLLRAIAPG